MTTKLQIEQFLANEPIAMAGVSGNPNLDSINGTACYSSVKAFFGGLPK